MSAITRLFAREGVKVVINSRRNGFMVAYLGDAC